MKKKKCQRCGEKKELSEYWQDSRTPDGYKYRCKDCCKKTGPKTANTVYLDKAPICECGGKVITAPEELPSGSARSALVWMCCNCGAVLGRYKYTGLSPEDLIEIHERPGRSDYWEECFSSKM